MVTLPVYFFYWYGNDMNPFAILTSAVLLVHNAAHSKSEQRAAHSLAHDDVHDLAGHEDHLLHLLALQLEPHLRRQQASSMLRLSSGSIKLPYRKPGRQR